MNIPPVVTDTVNAIGPALLIGVPAALVALIALAALLRRWTRGQRMARVVSTTATALGLAWSAQGMWDTAVNHYGVAAQIASVLFVVFEAMQVSQMLRAHEYRTDRRRRARFVKAVWVIAAVMGMVVALGEGMGQAPLRLSVPLLVAYGWWLDLTADDDPAEKPETSWRWTMREIGLRAGLLHITDADRRDPTEAERKNLTDRIGRLAFALEHGSPRASILLRRRIRLARLKLSADREIMSAVAERLRLSSAPIEPAPEPAPVEQPAPEVHPVAPEQPAPPIIVQPDKPMPVPALPTKSKELAYRLMHESITEQNRSGMTARQLAEASGYSLRTAETIATQVRRERSNGRVPHDSM